jgi:hypothetical protein
MSMKETYKIIRFFLSGRKKVMKTGLTLEAAQAHCRDPKTQKKGEWFDGFEKE